MIGTGDALDLVDHLLEPVLELSLDPGACLQQAEVERPHRDVLEHGRNVALGNSPCQALDDGRLAHAGLAGQDRVVLAAADQDIDHLAHLGLAADDRVDLSLAGSLGQVDRELVERRASGSCPRSLGRRSVPGRRRPMPG